MRLHTGENEQTKAYVRTTVLEWEGRHVNMDTKILSGDSFYREYNQAIKHRLLIMRRVWPGEEAKYYYCYNYYTY